MTTEIAAGGAPASPVPPVVTPPEPPKPHTLAAELPPDTLKARLDAAKETARRELLTELGIESPDAAKAALAAHRAAEDAKKTETERAAAQAVRLANLEAAVTAQWQHEAAGLTDEQRKAVTDLAGTDVAGCLRTLNVLRSTWGKPTTTAAPVIPSAPPAAPPVAPVPAANSAPAPTAPPPTGQLSPPDPKAIYSNAMERNPFIAAEYGLRNPQAYGS